jgi:hypothetical protein
LANVYVPEPLARPAVKVAPVTPAMFSRSLSPGAAVGLPALTVKVATASGVTTIESS